MFKKENKMKDRLKEPSTYGGLAAIIFGLGQIFDIDEAPAVAETLTAAIPQIISGNWLGMLMVLLGGAGVILREKGK